MFRGLALGGPLDGKRIEFEGPTYKVPELNKLEPFVSLSAEIPAAMTVEDVFTYEHYETPGGDVWVPSEVMRGERYEHKIYKHSLDFIFSKLIRGYRPEGF